jgi:uncharacterized membrane protein HdeD (DUF308 family)
MHYYSGIQNKNTSVQRDACRTRETVMPIGLPADPAALRNHSTWFIVYGVVLCLFGLFAIAAPGVATLAVGLTVGWLLLLGGAMGIVAVISSGRSAPGFW